MYESEQELLQYVLKELVEEYGYSQEQIDVQVKIPGELMADCVVYADERKKQPFIVVEVKKSILYPVAVEQLATYIKRLGASYGMLTDGVKKFFFIPFGKELIEVSSIPTGEGVMFHDMLSERAVSPRELQLPANLSYRLQKMFDFIRSNEKLPPESVVEEIHKLILCKVEGERSDRPIGFWIEDEEARRIRDQTIQELVRIRLERLFSKVKTRYSRLYPRDEPLRLSPLTLAYCVAQLQNYSFRKASFETISDAYEQFISKSMYGYLGQHFTPKPLVNFIIKLLDPTEKDRVLDPACGSGGFLISGINYVGKKIGHTVAAAEYAVNNVFGIDIDPKMITICKLNMVLQGDGHAHLYQADFLSNLSNLNKIRPESFDIVIVDPPKGSIVADRKILKDLELGWGRKTQQIHVLFLEKCIRMLKPAGRLVIIVPESLLTRPTLGYVRDFLLRKTFVRAIISLPAETFVPYLGKKVNVILFQKKLKPRKREDYEVFMVEAFDSRKKTLDEIVENYRQFITQDQIRGRVKGLIESL